MSLVPNAMSELTPEQKRALLLKLVNERNGEGSHPLSHGQRALWFVQQTFPQNSAYNIGNAVVLHGQIDVPTLQDAVEKLLKRHTALRSVVQLVEGQPRQHVGAATSTPLSIEEGVWTDEELRERVHAVHLTPFDLEVGPLFRAHLFLRQGADAVLLFTAHHIVSDGWSFGLLMEELRQLYDGARSGRTVTLPATTPYAHFVRWQSEMLESARGAELEAYWRERLAGELPRIEMPTDRPRPPIRRLVGAIEALAIDDVLIGQIRAAAREHRVTLFSYLLAVFHTLLYRYSGQTDVTVLTPMAGRSRSDFERSVGYFVSPTVLRTTFDSDRTFRELAKSTHETVLGALEHQDFPFPLLVERLSPSRDLGRSPIADIMFNMLQLGRVSSAAQTAGSPHGTADGAAQTLTMTPYPLIQEVGQFDLALEVVEFETSLLCIIRYSTDLYERETVVNMLGHFRTLLEATLATPDERVSHLPMLTPDEHSQFSRWNATASEYPRDRCLHNLIEEQAARTPDAVAVVAGGDRLTYRDLDRQAASLAIHLRRLGVGPNSLVGLAVRRSPKLVVGLLGILKAGGAYVPLDPTYPTDRLTYMLKDAGATVLVTEADLRSTLPTENVQVVELDILDAFSEMDDGTPQDSSISPEHLAYAIYTSGSTGRPKGVMISHRAAVNFVTGLDRVLPATASDAIGAVTSISFDIAVLELLWPLTRGARTVIVDDPAISPRRTTGRSAADRTGDTSLAGAIGGGANVLQCTPSMLRLILHDARSRNALRDVHLLLLGGEPVTPELIQDARAQTGARIFNMYGPTETTVWSAAREIERIDDAALIGPPFPNTQLAIVDKAGQVTPVGVPGELWIGGDGLSHGYINRPDLTVERFVQDGTGAHFYRTGDLARYQPDGTIEFLGRLDRLVKLHGYRIELPEIEAVLSQHPQIREACAIVREDVPGDRRLVAYIVGDGGEATSPAQVRRFLREHLPDYMVPSVYVRLDAFPLTMNGKLDMRQLPLPNVGSPLEKVPGRARTPSEDLLAPILEAALGISRIEPTDTFVDLGGHSLLAAEVAAKIATRTGIQLNPGLVMFQTLAQLAEACEAANTVQTVHVPVVPVAPDEPVPAAGVRGRFLRVARQLLPSARTRG